MTITDRQIDNWFYGKYLHDHIRTIIQNVTYYYDFSGEYLTFDDVEAELFMHLQVKKEALRKYSGNWYNIIFTCFKMKTFDILRSHKVSEDKIKGLLELCKETIPTQEEAFYELDEPQHTAQEAPEVLPIEGMEVHKESEAATESAMRDMRPQPWPANASKRSRSHRTVSNCIQLTIGFPEFAIAM